MKQEGLIDLSALRIFSVVAESTTLTQAATRLGVTQSAVSQAIKQIEQLTQTTLVVRRSRPIKLTPSGVVLRDYAVRMLSESRTMMHDVRMAARSSLGRLNIGVIDSFGDMMGRQLIERAEPLAARLALRTGIVPTLSQALIDGDLDVFFTSDQLPDHPEFGAFPVLRDPFVLLVPASFRPKCAVTAADMVNKMPFIRYDRQSSIGRFVDLIGRREGIELDAQLEVDSTRTMMKFVQAGKAWTITSAMCFIRYPELLDDIRIIELGRSGNARSVCLLHRHRELGDVPRQLAQISRELFDDKVVPEIIRHAPWLDGHVHSISDMPII
ncbi:MAG: LysR family transcriptional regulator [Pseudomonadota bacterium]